MNNKLKWKYLVYVFIFILASVLARGMYDYHKHQSILKQDIDKLTQDSHLYFSDLKRMLKDRYVVLPHHYANEPFMASVFQQKNREALHAYVIHDYQRLQREDSNLHIMHFIDTQNHTLLRMHQPNNFGDDLTHIRPIVRDANQLKLPLQGFEVGKNGITYRIATPLINHRGEHFGLLEFGVRPNYFVEKMVSRFGIESMILVKSDSLGKLLADYRFEQMGDYSIIQQSALFKKLMSNLTLDKQSYTVKVDGQTYLIITSLNQTNHQGEVVSKIVVAKNISEIVKQNNLSLLKENAVNLFGLLFLLVLVYAMFSRYGRALENSYHTIQALHIKSHDLKNQANTDELTGLYNRRFFNQALTRILELKESGSLVFFDIDHFKSLNDAHGHHAGDKVLIELASMMQNFFRQDDLLVRWGGEEFVVFINNISLEDAVNKADRFRAFVESSATKHQPFAFTISGGVTHIRADDTLDKLFQRADQRLYAAKETGRNRIIGAEG